MVNKRCIDCFKNESYISPNSHKLPYCLKCWGIRALKRAKSKNYIYEKNEKQRKLRYIKRMTRKKYPLDNKKCEFCENGATEHHHNTKPIEIDKFNYVCHSCHINKNKDIRRLRTMSRTKGSKNKPKIKIMNAEENAEMARKVEENDRKTA